MAIVDDTARPAKGPPMIVQIAILAVLTFAAIGIGWASGTYLIGNRPAADTSHAEESVAYVESRLSEQAGPAGVVYLDPITTNLSAPHDVWARLELALAFEGEADPVMAQAIQQDVLAYLRTVKFHQVEGASGFQHLKADLEERAQLRSEGKIKQLFIRSLLFE